MDSAAARRPAAPGCRPARWSAPRCAPAARRAVPAPDIKELTGGFPTPPIPPAALVTGGARRIGRALGLALAADPADEGAAQSRLPQAVAALGPIAVLVNNASVFENDTVATVSRQGW